MNEAILADFELLFDDNAPQRQLDRVRWVASACLMISTLFLGTSPLTLRMKYSEEWILKTFGKPNHPSTRTFITSAMICACSGVLLSLVFVCLLPNVIVLLSGAKPAGPGIDMCIGFMLTFAFQEFVLIRFGNTDRDYINQCHIYIVQFIRCELGVWKTLPSEPRRPSEELREEQELAAEIIQMRQLRGDAGLLDLSDTGAVVRSMSFDDAPERSSDDAPGRSRLGSYFVRRQAYLRERYPVMNWMVYTGATFLTLHSIMDGFCIALQPTIAETWFVFGNLLIHRVLIAVITTIELMSSNFRSKQIAIVVFIISIMPALGGAFCTYIAASTPLPKQMALLLGFSAGSLLYVIFFELSRGDKNEHIEGPCQCFCTLLGFLVSTFTYALTTGNGNS